MYVRHVGDRAARGERVLVWMGERTGGGMDGASVHRESRGRGVHRASRGNLGKDEANEHPRFATSRGPIPGTRRATRPGSDEVSRVATHASGDPGAVMPGTMAAAVGAALNRPAADAAAGPPWSDRIGRSGSSAR